MQCGLRRVGATAVLAAALIASCVSVRTREKPPPVRPPSGPSVVETAPRDYPGLHNVVAFHEGFYSGSVPEGPAGFDALAVMGVRTVISVDGAAPDLELASARGLRYIHLPIGYNGIDQPRRLELARAVRDSLARGPVYIHCHHGKHRSAGAAGTVAASLGWSTPQAMVERMRVAGTSPSYAGLYACTAAAAALALHEIEAVSPEFPEVSRPTEFVQGMVEIDHAWEHLHAAERAGWAAPADHPDLVPAAEAGRMVDLFRVMAEGERTRSHPAEFGAKMRQGADLAKALEDLLAAGERDRSELSAAFAKVGASCKDCHTSYRD
ncbi:MAG: cytochrome c [Phycisphaerales bacterium]